MDVLTNTKMPDRCAAAPQDSKHMGCTDAPIPISYRENIQMYRAAQGAYRCLGSIWTYGGMSKHTGASDHMGAYRCMGHTDAP